jgi:hypothetical protein
LVLFLSGKPRGEYPKKSCRFRLKRFKNNNNESIPKILAYHIDISAPYGMRSE